MTFLYSSWQRLPIVTRMKIALAFGIPKTGSTHVANDVIQADGYHIQDIEGALTIKALQTYLKTFEENTDVLWLMLVDHVEGKKRIDPAFPIGTLADVVGEPKTIPINEDLLHEVKKRKYGKNKSE